MANTVLAIPLMIKENKKRETAFLWRKIYFDALRRKWKDRCIYTTSIIYSFENEYPHKNFRSKLLFNSDDSSKSRFSTQTESSDRFSLPSSPRDYSFISRDNPVLSRTSFRKSTIRGQVLPNLSLTDDFSIAENE